MANRFGTPVPVRELGQKLNILYRHSAGVDGHAAFGRLFRKNPADPESGISGKAVSKWIEGEGSRDHDQVPAERWAKFVEIFRARLPGRRHASEVETILSEGDANSLLSAFVDRPPAIDWLERAMSAPPALVALVRAPAPGTLAITTRNRPLFADEVATYYVTGRDFRFLLGDVARGWLLALQWDAQRGWHGLDLADEGEDTVTVGPGEFLPAASPYLVEHEAIDRAYFFVHSLVPLPASLTAQAALSARGQALLDAAFLQRLAQHLDTPGVSLSRMAVAFRG